MKPHAALLLACAAAFTLPVGAVAQDVFESAAKDGFTRMRDDSPAMAAAFRRARDTLDGFLKLLEASPKGTHSYAVKLRVVDGNEVEYFWIINLMREGARYSGTLDNPPLLVKNVREGQVMHFGRGDIVDWFYMDVARRRMMGNFTLCALLTLKTPDAAAEVKRQVGLVCD